MSTRSGWLKEKFTELFVELTRQRVAVQSGRLWASGGAATPFDPQRPGARGPNPAWEAIAGVLRRQAEEASRGGAAGLQIYQEAQFAMVALADEVFLDALGDWPGRQDWLNYPLQTAFFNRADAGTEVFKRIDRLLARRDPGERDLAEVYFSVLSLGFRGKYEAFGGGKERKKRRSRRPPPEIDEYRRRLHDCFTDGRGDARSVVSPQAYEHVERRELGGMIPSTAQAATLLAVVLAAMILTAWFSRSRLEAGIDRQLDRIERSLDGRE